jgi:hypothetical protein
MKNAAYLVWVLAGCAEAGRPPASSNESNESNETSRVRDPEGPRHANAPRGRFGDGFYLEDGAPDPLACATDADCTYGGVLAENGCCWSFRDYNAVAMTVAYRDWAARAREASCDIERCPSPPVPSQPPDCLFAVSCRDARCTNACAP